MKRKVLAIATIVTLGLAGYQLAQAGPGGAGGPGPGFGQGACFGNNAQGQLTEEQLKAREQFFEETTELRKEMAAKQAELAAVMNSATPDEKKAAKLSSELFDLQDEMRKKARTGGFGPGCNGPCGGPGMGMGMMMGMGFGPGGRRGW